MEPLRVGYREKLRQHPRKTEHYITMAEAIERVPLGNVRNIVLLPPSSGDMNVPSDEDDIPDVEDDIVEVAGEVEVDVNDSSSSEDGEHEEPATIRWRKHTDFDHP